jgi:CHAT domain-containing protein/tetratricopeptide (TPR) repeat protein
LGILFAVVSLTTTVDAADVPPASSWAALTAEREQLGKQFRGLFAAKKTDEAAAVAEKLITADRRILALPVAGDAEKKTQQGARLELIGVLRWIVGQMAKREDLPAAARRQRELADIVESYLGDSDYRAIDARSNQAYYERVASLKPEEVRELVGARRSLETMAELSSRGKFREAVPLVENAIKIQQRLLGNSSAQLAVSLGWLGYLYTAQRDFARAELAYCHALEIRKKVLGENHPDYAASLINLGAMYSDRADYARAEPYYRQALDIRKKVLGENHPDYGISLGHLAGLYLTQGDFARAEPLMLQFVEATKRVVGENHPDYATSLNNLAGLYEHKGDYARAEPLLRQTLEIRKKTCGENHPDYANSLNNLAFMYDSQGDYVRAEPLLRQALEIRRKALGENHPDYALSLNNLAWLYESQGDYARAEPLLRHALEIRKKVLGENHPDYAQSLNNLAMLYKTQGDDGRAEPLFRQTLEIKKKTLGENHPDYALNLNNLAVLYEDRGDYGRAEPLLRQALEIRKKVLGENHPDYAQSLNNLAWLFRVQGDYARAEPLDRQALEIRKRVLGENHPDYAVSLNNLASLYKEQGDYARAEPLYRQALEIKKKVLGENHPNYATVLGNLATLHQAQGDYAGAEPLLRQAVTIEFNRLEATAVIQSERQQLAMLGSVRSYLNGYLALSTSKAEFPTPAYRLMLAWKGMVFRRERLARAGEQTPELAALFRQLQQVARELGKLVWAIPDPKQVTRWKEDVARLTEKKEQLEAELSSRSAAFRHAKAPTTLEDVQAALPKDVVLVDFLEFWHQEWVTVPQRGGLGIRLNQTERGAKVVSVIAGGAAAKDGRLQLDDLILEITDQTGKWSTTAGKSLQDVIGLVTGIAGSKVGMRVRRAQEQELQEITLIRARLPGQKKFDWKGELEYVAFVVRHDGPVVRLNLGPAWPMSAAIDTWRETCGMSPQSAAAGRLLREKIWAPIAAHVHGAKIVLISPDGALSKLPLEALPGKEPGKYLIEEYPLAIIPTAQMIPEIVRGETRKPLPGNLLLVGNIDYDGQSGPPALSPSGSPKSLSRDLPQGFVHFNRLPATQREVALIEKLYHQDFGAAGIKTLQEDQATKAAFLAEAGRYRYLHLATHGFFIQEKLPAPVAQSNRGAALSGGPQSAELHAGLLSGLALAGANQASKPSGSEAAGGADNGILTAEEIGTQNLDGVQLVMLSACETGLGKAAGGEGLLGLQRSFQAAGARSVVASLWKVPDEETKALMGAFYTNLWQKKLSPLESLRQAQLAMLRNYDPQAGRLRAPDFSQAAVLPAGSAAEKPATSRRTRQSPAYWAAFVLSGDWR